MLCRTYPSSFRSRLDRSSAPASPAVGCALIEVSCECGQLSLEVELQPLPRPLRCHCNRCRRFGTTAFAAFIPVAPTAVAALLDSGKHASFEDTCSVLGPVERIFCPRCRARFAFRRRAPASEPDDPVYVGLGCCRDDRLEASVALLWQRAYDDWALEEAPAWASALPAQQPIWPAAGPSVRVLHGGCACGRCTFEARSGDEFQLQHCYCGLCRRFSGSVGQTCVINGRDSLLRSVFS